MSSTPIGGARGQLTAVHDAAKLLVMIQNLGQPGDPTLPMVDPTRPLIDHLERQRATTVGEQPVQGGPKLLHGVVIQQGVGASYPLPPATIRNFAGLALLPDLPVLDQVLEVIHQVPGVGVDVEDAPSRQQLPGSPALPW